MVIIALKPKTTTNNVYSRVSKLYIYIYIYYLLYSLSLFKSTKPTNIFKPRVGQKDRSIYASYTVWA